MAVSPISNNPWDQLSLDIFGAAKEGKWDELRNIISERFLYCSDFMRKDLDKNNFTILHHACNIGNRKVASDGVNSIFDAVQSYFTEFDELYKFVNAKDTNGETALHIALKQDDCYAATIIVLLDNGADVDTDTFSSIQAKYGNSIVLRIFDRGITLKKDSSDPTNEELWTLEHNFRKITGITSKTSEENDIYRESKQLATILDHLITKQTIILSHPLVQLFLTAKRKRFQILIWFSIVYHVIWSISSAAYITCNVSSKKESSNKSTEMVDSENWIKCNYPIVSFVPIFGLTMFIKEITEFVLSRSKCFYVKQGENWGQWVVLIIVYFIAILNVSETMSEVKSSGVFTIICPIGLAASLLLIQVQFTKIETLGIYLHLMSKGFLKILKLLLVFLPLLSAYLLIFRFLMPENPSYFINWGLGIGKILAGMTGELNYDELFDDESVEKMISVFTVRAFLIFFIISIVILFQNMLIALSMNDIEKLKAKATVAHLAISLEVIYLMEAFLMHDYVLQVFEFFKLKDKVVRHFCVNELKPEIKSQNTVPTECEENGAVNIAEGCYSYRCCFNWGGGTGSSAKPSSQDQVSHLESQPLQDLQQKQPQSVTSLFSREQATAEKSKSKKFATFPRKIQELVKDREKYGIINVTEL